MAAAVPSPALGALLASRHAAARWQWGAGSLHSSGAQGPGPLPKPAQTRKGGGGGTADEDSPGEDSEALPNKSRSSCFKKRGL